MTIQEIFNTVQYGEEYCNFQTIKESIERNYDKDTDIFHASGRINELTKGMALTEEFEKIIDHITNKCDVVETRLYNEDKMSPNYKKLQACAILEDCNKIISKSNKRGTYATLPGKEEFAKIVATAKYFVESYLDEEAVLKESTNVEFSRMIKDETYNIEQVL